MNFVSVCVIVKAWYSMFFEALTTSVCQPIGTVVDGMYPSPSYGLPRICNYSGPRERAKIQSQEARFSFF